MDTDDVAEVKKSDLDLDLYTLLPFNEYYETDTTAG